MTKRSARRTVSRRLATGLACVLVAAGCGSGEDSAGRDRGDATAAPSSGSRGEGASADGSAPTGTGAAEYATDPVVVENPAKGELVSVTAEQTEGAERLSFEFSGEAPGYRVEIVPRITAGPEGDVVDVAGEAYLSVAFTSTTPSQDGQLGEDVPTNADLGLPLLRQIVLVYNVAGDLRFGVGVGATTPTFRVATLDDPARVVVEVRAD